MDELASGAKTPESLRRELVRSFAKFELSFRRRFPLLWGATLAAPVLLSATILVFLGITVGWDYSYKFITHAFLTFFFFGRFIILLGMEGDVAEKFDISMEPLELFGLVTYMDFVVALFVTFHMGILFRLPYVGQKIAMLVWDGKFIMNAQPWVKRMAFLGLVLFVIFPTSTTGSIGGSIFGRLLGMSRFLTVTGVLCGSVLGNALMYAFSKTINQYISPDNVWLKVAGLVIVVVLVAFLELRYQKVKKKYLNVDENESGEDTAEAKTSASESNSSAETNSSTEDADQASVTSNDKTGELESAGEE